MHAKTTLPVSDPRCAIGFLPNRPACSLKSLLCLIALAFCASRLASAAEPPKIKGYTIGMPVEAAMDMNRKLLSEFLTKTRQGQTDMVWDGGLDYQTKTYRYNLLHRISGDRETDSVRGTAVGGVDRIVFDRLTVALFQIEAVDNLKIVKAFETAYGLSGGKVTDDAITGGLTAVWYLPMGIKITIQCYNDSLRMFAMEKADDDESLRAKLN